MRKSDIKQIEQLVEKFFDGSTTEAEEQRLYAFFKRRDVPRELEKYRKTLAAFGAVSQRKAPRHARILTLRRAITGIAAAALLLFGAALYADFHEEQALTALYEGSYVIVNGQKIDDLSAIKADIQSALCDAKHIEARAEQASVAEQAERNVLQNITDPELKRQVEEMLK